jgi:hypothetical protein
MHIYLNCLADAAGFLRHQCQQVTAPSIDKILGGHHEGLCLGPITASYTYRALCECDCQDTPGPKYCDGSIVYRDHHLRSREIFVSLAYDIPGAVYFGHQMSKRDLHVHQPTGAERTPPLAGEASVIIHAVYPCPYLLAPITASTQLESLPAEPLRKQRTQGLYGRRP